jgi:hypothetical protein
MDAPYDDFERQLETMNTELSRYLQTLHVVPKPLATLQKAIQARIDEFKTLKADRAVLQMNLVYAYGGRKTPDPEL